MKLPEQYEQKMRSLLGTDFENYENSFSEIYGQTFRVNTLKIEPAELIRRFTALPGFSESLFRQIPWCETGYYYAGAERLSKHPFYYAGLYYIQEPSAMAPAAFLPVNPGERVLDLCAAPGGKTTALAAKLRGQGILVANDISVSRCQALLKNTELAGVTNCVITSETPEKLADHFPEYFDRILIDAPCSGEGMFRRDPSMVKGWSEEAVKEYASLQKEILTAADRMLKPGGMLLYSTCTYSPEEDEQSVEILLEKDYSLIPVPEYSGIDSGHPEWSRSGNPELVHCRRFWNHRVHGEGQFAALLRKSPAVTGDDAPNWNRQTGQNLNEDRRGRRTQTQQRRNRDFGTVRGRRKKDAQKEGVRSGQKRRNTEIEMTEEMRHFLSQQNLCWDEEQIQFVKERAYLLPKESASFHGLRVVRSGLYLGDVKKKRFEPSQALAMALDPDTCENVLNLTAKDERVERYLRGETIFGEAADGYVLVCLEQEPLGWAKCSKGTLKNKYNPGWRKNG